MTPPHCISFCMHAVACRDHFTVQFRLLLIFGAVASDPIAFGLTGPHWYCR